MTYKMLLKKITAMALALVIVMTALPTAMLTSAAAADTRIADASTMDDWHEFFGNDVISTKNAGGVWTDKSVFTDASAFDGTGIAMSGEENDSFLVALSAIASSKTVTGHTNRPTDTMMILDVSGSMNNSNSAVADEMVEAANDSIAELLALNPYNRVGIVLYSGASTDPTNGNAAQVLLPLGRYVTDTDGRYLNHNNGGNGSVSLDRDVCYEGTTKTPPFSSKDVVGATYIQKGLVLAKEQMVKADTTVADDVYGEITRIPVLMLMSDGAPTLTSTNFTAPGQYNMGNGQARSTSDAQGFVTQLTAAYVKAEVEAHYKTDCKFYTLGLGVSSLDTMTEGRDIAVSVLDPSNSTTAINGFWTQYDHLAAGASMRVQGNGNNARSVTKIETALSQQYADQYFEAKGTGEQLAANIAAAFKEIVGTIQLQSNYFPTLVEDHEDFSGYISFVDRIGQYMEVTEVKGILLHNTLFSGAHLSENFVEGGGSLGTYDSPTALGREMVAAVRQRIGLATHEEAVTLIGLAYEHGQIAYDPATGEFSNYIGWYANAAGEFLGFWYDGMTTLPDPSDPTLTDDTRPVYIMKSYGFLGEVDEAHGVKESDMMYVIVQEREEIATEDTMISFGIPASLIPVVTYQVELSEDNQTLTSLTVDGAEHPIRLVYEVALREDINEYNVASIVGDDYAYRNADGSYSFYTNQWESDTAYGTVNTYSYFVPSKQNERYYYVQDNVVYTDENGTAYMGDTLDPNGEFYRRYDVYTKNGEYTISTRYERVSALSLSKATQHEDGYWYVPAGTVHTYLDGYTVNKTVNATTSSAYVNQPFVDARYDYYVGATLGNNGVLTVMPATGIALSKTLTETVEGATDAFTFTITQTDAAQTASFDALRVAADGSESEEAVRFTNGVASVTLAAGETLYIAGMQEGAVYRVTEDAHEAYSLSAINGDTDATEAVLTIVDGTYQQAAFTNAPKREGDLVIVKRIVHPFGDSYEIPDKAFTIEVDLGEAYAEQTITAALSADTSVTSVMTDKNGKFTVSLSHSQQLELFGLIEGTVVKVTELDPPAGFAPTYNVGGELSDGTAVVEADVAIAVVVTNNYTPDKVPQVNINIEGTKTLRGRNNDTWIADDIYTFELQKYTADGWKTIATDTVDASDKTFDFNDVMAAEVYTAPGEYSYQIIETVGNVAGVTYDPAIHTFTVIVGDTAMNGTLQIMDVVSYVDSDTVTGDAENGWLVTTDFTNVYDTTGNAQVILDIEKGLLNASNSDIVSLGGYCFGLYAAGETMPAFVSSHTDAVGEARLIAEFSEIGEYTYQLKEVVPADRIPGMKYTTAAYDVTISVYDNHDGTLGATVTVTDEENNPVTVPTFTNEYDPTDATLTIPVHKTLNGRKLKAGEFTFQIKDGDTVLAEGTNDENGQVVFDSVLTFHAVGDYYYDIVEVAGDALGIIYDTAPRTAHIHVSDSGDGSLSASYHLMNAVGTTVEFTNTYQALPAELVLDGTKTLYGRPLLNEEFEFILLESGVTDGLMLTTHNFADGTFRFDPIEFTQAGTYSYTVQEAKAGGDSHITYDETIYTVVVTVTDDGNGQLAAEVTSITADDSDHTDLDFENIYLPDPTQAAFGGTKELSGRVLGDGEFTFELYEADADWVQGDRVRTAVNDADGMFAFEPIVFHEAGICRYLVKEQHGGETIDGVAYDDSRYGVVVYVEDNGHGKLQAITVMVDEDGIPVDDLLFNNIYTVSGNVRVAFEGTKTLVGKDLAADDYVFLLYEADETFTKGRVRGFASNDADGSFAFDPLTLSSIGTYRYVIAEDGGGDTVQGVTYDATEYHITVDVTDNGKGGLESKKTVTDQDGNAVDAIAFENVYTVTGEVSLDLGGKKTLSGRTLAADEFAFLLHEADADFVKGDIVDTAYNTAKGAYAFDTLTFDTVGTYYYVIAEEHGGETVDKVSYDDATYHVAVKVTDNGKGGLAIEKTVTDAAGNAVKAMDFENIYTPDPADITVPIGVQKTVKIEGEGTMSPEGFTFELKDTVSGEIGTVTADADGNAVFTLAFSKNDIGKTFTYEITEVDDGRENVTYDTTVHTVSIRIDRGEDNTLQAIVECNDNVVAEAQVTFENIFTPPTTTTTTTTTPSDPTTTTTATTPTTGDTPKQDAPKTGETGNLTLWLALLFISGGAFAALAFSGKKKTAEE